MSDNKMNSLNISSLKNNQNMIGIDPKLIKIISNFKYHIGCVIIGMAMGLAINTTESDHSVMLERNKNVLLDGTISFIEDMDGYLTLEDLSPDETFLFFPSKKTQQEMKISTNGAFMVYKADENIYNDDGILLVKKGDYFAKLSNGNLSRVVISNGDIIIDSLSDDFHEKTNGSPLSKNIMTEVSKLLPRYSQSSIKSIYSERFPDYQDLITHEYKELLTQDGISLETSFASYLVWLEQNNLGVSESTMKQYLDQFVTKPITEKTESDSINTTGSALGSIVDDLMSSISQGFENLGGSMGNDDKILSYKDERFGESDVIRKDHGALLAIVRLQGHFFDPFTYNRLTGNFYSKVSVESFENQEYVALSSLRESLSGNVPGDIHKNAKSASMTDIINHSTSFNVQSDNKLKKALQFSVFPGSNDTKLSDFEITYTSGGTVGTIEYKGKPLNISRIYIEPSFLRKLPGNTAEIKIGNYIFSSNLNDYFDQYKKLEVQNNNIYQTIRLFNLNTGEFSTMRNMLWFIEKDVDLYKQLAEDITKGSSSNIDKLKELLTWVQLNASYIDEISEINKIALGTLWDRGGDCEDGFILFKTLAEHIGLGDSVGAVYFESHIAPIIKGNHGGRVYNIEGSDWTIAELATQKGETVALGETNQTDPLFYMLQNNKVISTESNIVPISIVSESNIDPDLVTHFNSEIQKISKLILQSNDGKSSIQDIQIFRDNLTESFNAIAQKGKLSEGIYENYIKNDNALLQLQQDQKKIEQDIKDALMVEKYTNKPELIQGIINDLNELNTATSIEKMKAITSEIEQIILEYKGAESNYKKMYELKVLISDVINKSKIYIHMQEMQNLYSKKKKILPKAYSNAMTKIIEQKRNMINDYVLFRYNEVGNLLNNMEDQ